MLKRAADGNWTRSERVRRALESANDAIRVANGLIHGAEPGSLSIHRSAPSGPEPVEEFMESASALIASLQSAVRTSETATSAPPSTAVLALPDDCLRIVLELALSQRTMSVYRADGSVSEPRDYYDVEWFGSGSIRTLRRVSRQWNRVASSLVRTIRMREDSFENVPPTDALLRRFPNATAVSYNPDSLVSDSNANAIFHTMIERRPQTTRSLTGLTHITRIPKPDIECRRYPLFRRVIRRRDGTCVIHEFYANSLSYADVFRLPAERFVYLLEIMNPAERRQPKIRVYLDNLQDICDSDMDRIQRIPKDARMLFDIHLMSYGGDPNWTLTFVALFGKATVHMNASARNTYFDGYRDTLYDLEAYDALARDYIVEPLV